jgi:hypothetical protein
MYQQGKPSTRRRFGPSLLLQQICQNLRALLLAQMVCKIYDIETGHIWLLHEITNLQAKKLSIGINHRSLRTIIWTCSTQSISSTSYFPSPRSSGTLTLTNAKSTDLGKLSANGQSGMTKWIISQNPTGRSHVRPLPAHRS